MRKRNHRIFTRLNDEEFAAFRDLCKISGLGPTVLLRKLIGQVEIRERPNLDFRSLARAVDRIGNNYNQIAHKVNARGEVTRADMEESRLLLREVKTEIESWKAQWL